jgi:hypothetical protein
MIGKESAIADDDAHGHFSFVRHTTFHHFLLDAAFARREIDAVGSADRGENGAPPDVGVQVVEDDRLLRGMKKFVEARAANEQAIHQQRVADEEPD